MRAIRSRDTVPELRVRHAAHTMGYRFRLHRSALPGKPDLAFLGRKKLVFVHGCFWHQHPMCRDGRVPRSNKTYWYNKLAMNVNRDRTHLAKLRLDGWQACVLLASETE